MFRLVAFVALVWGLISCQPDLFGPDPSTVPVVPTPPTRTPGGPQPTIEIPPPI